jgi:tetratricopeptide (TPR) repeat protein
MRLAGRLYWQAGDQKAAQQQFKAAADLARALGDPSQFARAVLGYAGRSYDAEAIDPDLRGLFDEALEILPPSETATRARLLARLAEALHALDGKRAIDLTAEALDILRQAPDEDALTTVMAARHMTLLHIDYHADRLELGKRWIERTENQGDRLGHALHWRLFDLLERGDPSDISEVRNTRRRLGELAQQLDQPLFRHFVAAFDAKWLLMEGKFADADRASRQALAHGRRAQGSHVALLFGGQRLVLRRDQGRVEELAHDIAGVVDMDDPSLPAWRVALMTVFSESGDRDRAGAWLTELARDNFAAVPRDMFWLGTMCMAGESAAELVETRFIRDLLTQLEPYSDYNAQLGLSVMLGPVSGFVGRLAAAIGEHASAERHFGVALERCAMLGALPAKARIQWQLARSLLARNADLARATELLEHSRVAARELGMAGLEGRAARALTELGPA